jgi:predicted nucleic acid-binding protein
VTSAFAPPILPKHEYIRSLLEVIVLIGVALLADLCRPRRRRRDEARLVVTTWLIDKSALVRLAGSPDASQWANRVERGLARISTVTPLEVGFSARSADHLRTAVSVAPLARMPVEYLTPAAEDRALEVQLALAERGQDRAASLPDLLVAATAGLAQLTVLHVDKDFELIAQLTGQPVERLREG